MRIFFSIVAALLLASARGGLAHGYDHPGSATGASGHPQAPKASPPTSAPGPAPEFPPTYFAHPENTLLIYSHIVIMIVAWVFALPVAVMFSIAKSRLTSLARVCFLALNALGVVAGIAYNSATPDLYPGSIHERAAWVVTLLACVQVGLGVLVRGLGTGVSAEKLATASHESQAFIPVKDEQGERRLSTRTYHTPNRNSHDSGQGTEPNSSVSSGSHGPRIIEDIPLETFHGRIHDGEDTEQAEFRRPERSRWLLRVDAVSSRIPRGTWRILGIAYSVIDRLMLPLGFFNLVTGTTTFCRYLEGHEIYGGLAHFIKGGVFFWFGVLMLGRWSGCFGELGWAWNIPPNNSGRWRPSAEFVESATILVYGCTNIFLERLGGNGRISSKDLEHISIAALFIGGGLLGMLIESSRMRHFLNTGVEVTASPSSVDHDAEQNQAPPPYGGYNVPLNPIPALVVLLVGIMMSAHEQTDMVEVMIHKRWGDLLVSASVARMATYALLYLKPPQSVLPSRPPTELLAAFGLMAGGLVFMESTESVVAGMKHYDLDVMFVYTMTMGVVGLLMAWIIIVLVLKGWAVRREWRGHHRR